MIQELEIEEAVRKQFVEEARIWHEMYEDALISRGEYWSARILAAYLGWEFIDAHDIFELTAQGWSVMKSGGAKLLANVRAGKSTVVPGFYGRAGIFDAIKLFPRNGTDTSGILIAEVLKADRYEIWKDTAVRVASPKIVPNARIVPYLAYREARALTDRGSEVVHPDAVLLAQRQDLTIRVCDFNNPDAPGTIIQSDDLVPPPVPGYLSGVSGRTGMSVATITKSGMHEETGIAGAVMQIFGNHKLRIHHMPDGIDSIDAVVETDAIELKLSSIARDVQSILGGTAQVRHRKGYALVTVVGRGLTGIIPRSRLMGALGRAGIDPLTYGQGTEQHIFTFTVEEKDFENSIRAICREFT